MVQPKLLMVPKDDVDGRANSDIYAAVKQSNGSNFFLNRKDNIVLKGYLNKKSKIMVLFSLLTSNYLGVQTRVIRSIFSFGIIFF